MQVHNVRLMSTGAGTESMVGRNRVMLFFDEALKDRPQDYGSLRVACIDARYVNGAFKSPASGKVALTDKQFVDPASFKPDRDCVNLTAPDQLSDGGSRDGGDGGGGDGGH